MAMELKILFVEDVLADVELASRALLKEGILFQSRVIENEIDFIRELEDFSPNIIISDYSMPQFDGMRALKIALEKCPNIPFILLTGSMNEEVAVECMKAGASDYIIKESITRLPFAVKEALKKKEIQIEKEIAEFELKESEERFRSLYEHISLGLYRTTFDGNILLANPALVKMLGYQSFEELTQRNLLREVFESSSDRRQFIQLLEETSEVKGLESSGLRKDKSVIIVRESARAIRDVHGNILYYDGIIEDITEQKRAEEALIFERNLLRALLDNTPDHIYFKDLENRFIRMSKTQANRFGISDILQVIGKTDFDFFTEEHARKAFENEREIVDTGNPIVGLEEKEIWPDGTETWVSTTKAPLRDIEGKIIGTFGISRDITEHKQAEESIKEKMHELQRFHNLTVGRELSMIELKKEVNELLKKAGVKEKYRIVEWKN